MESNDSPEIPDRGQISNIPGLPSGAHLAAWSPPSQKKYFQGQLRHISCVTFLVSWYFEPSQPQRITTRLKYSICLLFTLQTSHQTTNYPKTTKSVLTQTHTKQTTTTTKSNIKHKILEELVPSVSPLSKKYIRLRHAGIVDHSVDLSIPDFKKV